MQNYTQGEKKLMHMTFTATVLDENIDLVDTILFYKAKIQDAKVLSFDKDFDKLK